MRKKQEELEMLKRELQQQSELHNFFAKKVVKQREKKQLKTSQKAKKNGLEDSTSGQNSPKKEEGKKGQESDGGNSKENPLNDEIEKRNKRIRELQEQILQGQKSLHDFDIHEQQVLESFESYTEVSQDKDLENFCRANPKEESIQINDSEILRVLEEL